MSEYTGFHHVAFATGDIEETTRFWRDLLGVRLVYSYGRPGYRQYFFEISQNNHISFFEWHNVKRVSYRRHGEPVEGPFIFDHISIGVKNDDKLWELMGMLDGAGFPVSDMINHGCFHSIYSYDPNGIPIEFSCNVPGIDIGLEPVIKDQTRRPSLLKQVNPVLGRWPKPDAIAEEDRVIVDGEGSEFF